MTVCRHGIQRHLQLIDYPHPQRVVVVLFVVA